MATAANELNPMQTCTEITRIWDENICNKQALYTDTIKQSHLLKKFNFSFSFR